MTTNSTDPTPQTWTAAAERLLRDAEQHDGVAPFSEAFVRGVHDNPGETGHRHFRRELGGELAGLAALAPDGSTELVVHPDARRRGLGRELITEVLHTRPDARLWAHGNTDDAQLTARAMALEPTRELNVMGIAGAALAAAARTAIPAGYEEITYAEGVRRWGAEALEEKWLAVNNDAFSWHPEQGGWDRARLRRAMDTEWFDPEGALFLVVADDVAGFHWTKVHPDGTGEVYVVGLASPYRGEGLGGPLVALGLRSLVERGCEQVILYVEADNRPAVRRYEEMGFTVRESHVVYTKKGI